MKLHSFRIMLSLVLLTLIIAGVSVYEFRTLEHSSRELERYILQVESSTRTGDWEKASEGLSRIESSWEGTEKKWAMLIDHLELDHIESTLSRMSKYVETKDVPSILAEAATLRMYIRHIPEKESLNWKNLF